MGQQENIKTFDPGRYTSEIQGVNCFVTGANSGGLGENIII